MQLDEFINRLKNALNKTSTNLMARYTMQYKHIENTMNGINENSNTLIGNLITLQSNILLSQDSPLDEAYVFNNYKRENELVKVFDWSKELDEHYTLFVSEIEVIENK